MDWNAIGALATAAGVVVAIVELVSQRWRRATTVAPPQRASGILGVLQELSPIEIDLLRHVSTLSGKLAALYAQFPANSPMNTQESNAAKSELLQQLRETELMQTVGVNSLSAFRTLGQNLQRLRLVDYEPFDMSWGGQSPWSMFITDLGAAALAEGLPLKISTERA